MSEEEQDKILAALSKLPAVDGSQLTNLPSASGDAVLASTQTFTGQNTFAEDVTLSGGVAGSTTFETATATTTVSGYLDFGLVVSTGSCNPAAAAECTATCPAGYYVISGGFQTNPTTNRYIYSSYRITPTTWYVRFNGVLDGAGVWDVYAYCARVKWAP